MYSLLKFHYIKMKNYSQEHQQTETHFQLNIYTSGSDNELLYWAVSQSEV